MINPETNGSEPGAVPKRGGISPEESPMRHAKVGDLMSLVSVLFDQQLVYGIHIQYITSWYNRCILYVYCIH